MSFPFETDKPIYLQIANELRRQILVGDYPPGSKLPSIRELSKIFAVTPNTIQRALQILEAEELLYTARAQGKYVSISETSQKKLREETLKYLVSDFFAELGKNTYTRAEVEKELEKAWRHYDRQ